MFDHVGHAGAAHDRTYDDLTDDRRGHAYRGSDVSMDNTLATLGSMGSHDTLDTLDELGEDESKFTVGILLLDDLCLSLPSQINKWQMLLLSGF